MFNNPLITITSFIITAPPSNPSTEREIVGKGPTQSLQAWLVFGAAAFLVSVPVFFQAPLVRGFPIISLLLTLFWLALGKVGLKNNLWGDLLIGFSWSWLAGSLYWGWLRQEPLLHLPVESIALPLVLWGIQQGWGKVGNFFYLGSLLGTALTDGYFYLTGLIPYWKTVMTVNSTELYEVVQQALTQVETPWGISCSIGLIGILLFLGLWSLQKPELHWRAFSGAIFSTIIVDFLFGLVASWT